MWESQGGAWCVSPNLGSASALSLTKGHADASGFQGRRQMPYTYPSPTTDWTQPVPMP